MARAEEVRRLFDELAELGPEEQAVRLAACADQELRREVEDLLHADGHASDVLRTLDGARQAVVSDPQAPVGSTVGRYEVLELLGAGSGGVVYKARDPRLDRLVALKLLAPERGADPRFQERLMHEARAASALDHPGIATVYEIDRVPDGRLFIAMAYYAGQTLKQRLEREGALSAGEALDVALQVARALERAHDAGVVHRDIKPANLLITDRGEVKILDFGLAQRAGGAGGAQADRRGTVAYMAPEQVRGAPLDHRSDLWSLGAVLYEMLAGEPPFGRGHPLGVLYGVLNETPPPPPLPPGPAAQRLGRIVERALAKDPARRYQRAGDFAADLAAVPRAPGWALPLPLSSFVGRERELEQLRALLARARLVTLTGAAGSGKTRLALEAARRLAPSFRDGAAFVPLAAVREPDLVASTIARALGIAETPARSALEALSDGLHDRELLLLLDNFEQVLAAAPQVTALLAACRGVRLLVTSRASLKVAGEQELPVLPLETPAAGGLPRAAELTRYPATQLFVERARAVDPDFAPDDEGAALVGRICARLDGLPLAIELAAAQVKLLPPQAMASRLEHRLDLLTGGGRDRPDRHQTLRTAIEWSYGLLEAPARAFYRRVAVFAGGWTLEAAEPVTQAAGELPLSPLAGAGVLLDHSLIRREHVVVESPRFVMLETIREYALELLGSGPEYEPTCRAHAHYFLALAERAEPELTGPEQARWLDRLEAEHDNFRAVLAWAEATGGVELGLRLGAALWRFWAARAYLREGRSRLAALAALPGERTAARARALSGEAILASEMADFRAARPLLTESLAIWRELGDASGAAVALNHLGWAAAQSGEYAHARALSNEALALNRSLGETRGVAVSLNNLGFVAHYEGDYARARVLHEESAALRRELGDRRGYAFALTNLAWAEQGAGAREQAAARLEEALAILTELEDKQLIAWVLAIKGLVVRDGGDTAGARAILEESVGLWREVGNRWGLAFALTQLGALLAIGDDAAGARRALDEAGTLWREIGSDWGVALTEGAAAGRGS